ARPLPAAVTRLRGGRLASRGARPGGVAVGIPLPGHRRVGFSREGFQQPQGPILVADQLRPSRWEPVGEELAGYVDLTVVAVDRRRELPRSGGMVEDWREGL